MSLATEIAGKLNYLNIQDKVAVNATLPYSGYTQVSKKLDNFVFQTSSSFLNKVADKNRYVKFGEKVVDTYGSELVTNGDFSNGTTGWSGIGITPNINDGKFYLDVLSVINGRLEQTISTTVGKTYIVKVFASNISSLNAALLIGSNPTNGSNLISVIAGNSSSIIETTFIATGTTTYISLIEYNGTNTVQCYFDNISVREIQTAQFTVPDVAEVITNGSNVTSVLVNAGDYVVDGSNISNITSNVFSGISGEVVTDYIPELVVGRKIGITVNKTGEGTLRIYFGFYNNSYPYIDTTHTGTKTFYATPTKVTTGITYRDFLGSSGFTIDNIVVTRVSDTFRAKQEAPIGTALTNTTYFEDRTSLGVTNQALAYHAYNTLTNAYEGIKTEVLFSDVSKEDLLDNSVWMARNGFSKVNEFLYSKGAYLCLPVGIWQSLNKGGSMPFLNKFGTKNFFMLGSATYGKWYLSNTDNYKIDSLSKCFINSNLSTYSGVNNNSGTIANGNSGIEDSKFYDIVYPDQFIDVREYSKIATDLELKLIRDDKEENGVEEIIFTEQVLQTTIGTVDTLEVGNGANYKVGSVLQIWNGTTPYRRYVASVSGNTVTLDSTIVKTAVPFIIGGGRLPILSSNSKLSLDLLGNLANHPQIFKDRLASGTYIVGVKPLLVDDLDNSLIPDGVKDSFKLSDKFTTVLQTLRSTDAGGTYTSFTATNSTTTNALTLTNEPTVNIVLVSTTSVNKPYTQTTPKPVIEVEPKVIASNSHSIYKGALLGNQVSGNIQVGNGANQYESKVLGNAEVLEGKGYGVTNIRTGSNSQLLYDGIATYFNAIELLSSNNNLDPSGNATISIGVITLANGEVFEVSAIKYVSSSRSIIVLNTKHGNQTSKDFSNSKITYFQEVQTTPHHSTVGLDSSTSSASKYFKTLEEGSNGLLGGVYGEEITYDGVGEWGDTGSFSQLTNGTTTDWNGSTVRTFHGSIPLNARIK